LIWSVSSKGKVHNLSEHPRIHGFAQQPPPHVTGVRPNLLAGVRQREWSTQEDREHKVNIKRDVKEDRLTATLHLINGERDREENGDGGTMERPSAGDVHVLEGREHGGHHGLWLLLWLFIVLCGGSSQFG
jgi:hypothetical protein